MNSPTEYQLSELDGGPLERLAIDLLTRQKKYRGIDPQGKRGKDGGKDGLLLSSPENETVIVHVSRRNDWDTKLKEDLEKTAEHDRSYDTVVFVTNRSIPGTQKPTPDVAQEFVIEHDCVIDLWDQQRLRAELDNNHQDLRQRYLRIARDDPPGKKAGRLIAERIRLLTRRDPELPEIIYEGPVAAIHIVPHGAITSDDKFAVDDLPAMLTPGTGGKSYDQTLDGVVGYDPGKAPGSTDPQRRYIYLDREGWVEFVTTNIFNYKEKRISGELFERYLVEAYHEAAKTILGLGFDGPVEVSVSLLSVAGFGFSASGGPRIRSGSGTIRQRDIEGQPYTVDGFDVPAARALKQGFDRAWRGARWKGSPHYTDDGEWKL